MSYDPVHGTVSISLRGDVDCGYGQLGLTTQTVDTINTPIIQAPGAFYSGYYSHYQISISNGNSGVFQLAPIGTVGGISVGYTCCVDCRSASATSNDSLTVMSSASVSIAQVWQSGKVFLTAVTAPATWAVSYGVPEGINNYLLVYSGVFPRVGLLPIQKEISIDVSNQYGIKCIQSYDLNDPANLPVGSISVTNENKIVFMGDQSVTATTLDTLTTNCIASIIACNGIAYDPDPNSLSLCSAFGSYASGGQGFLNIQNNCNGLTIIGSQNSSIDQTGGTTTVSNSGILWSQTGKVAGDGIAVGSVFNSGLIGSQGCIVGDLKNNDFTIDSLVIASNTSTNTNGASSLVAGCTNALNTAGADIVQIASVNTTLNGDQIASSVSSYLSNVADNIQTAIISSDAIAFSGDANFSGYTALTGWPNTHAGISVISSHGLSSISSAADIRYCVIGGYNAVTWSIDSKTGIHYGSNFNNTQPLPGFAEMFENAISGVAIPYGRLLQLESGKVRLAQKGESGFMISRPYESAAFVAGNPYHEWHKKYLVDQFGSPIMEELTHDEYITKLKADGVDFDESAIPDKVLIKKLNPDYKPDEYVPRSSRRDQWTVCEKSGMVVVCVSDSAVIKPGDYLISDSDGIAKRSLRKSNIRVLEIVDATHVKVDLANQHISDYVDATIVIADKVATRLPSGISIRDIQIAGDLINVSRDSLIKISLDLLGDTLLATDLSVSLVSESNSYLFDTSYCKSAAGKYKIKSLLKSVVAAGSYQIKYTTTKTLPTDCGLTLKAY